MKFRTLAIALLVKLDRIAERLDHTPQTASLDKLIEQNQWLLTAIEQQSGER